ncbi:MAG: hypothetical protein EZS28_037854, partial [Streblomastix strix]
VKTERRHRKKQYQKRFTLTRSQHERSQLNGSLPLDKTKDSSLESDDSISE